MENKVKRSMKERIDHLDTHMERIQQLLEHILEGRDPHMNKPLSIEKLERMTSATRMMTVLMRSEFNALNDRIDQIQFVCPQKKKRKK